MGATTREEILDIFTDMKCVYHDIPFSPTYRPGVVISVLGGFHVD